MDAWEIVVMHKQSVKHGGRAWRTRGIRGVGGVAIAGAALGLSLGTMPGCSSLAGMTEDYGDTSTVVPSDGDTVVEVAALMLREYQFTDVTAAATRLDGSVTGTSATGEVVEIRVEPAGLRTTKVMVSNAAGKPVAEVLLRGIERRLEERQAAGNFTALPPVPPANPEASQRQREAEMRELESSLGM